MVRRKSKKKKTNEHNYRAMMFRTWFTWNNTLHPTVVYGVFNSSLFTGGFLKSILLGEKDLSVLGKVPVAMVTSDFSIFITSSSKTFI